MIIALFQIFHGVWTLAFFVLTLVNTKTVLPNASCLLAGYLPATTVLHILLIPSDYPLPVRTVYFIQPVIFPVFVITSNNDHKAGLFAIARVETFL